jgi:hypothetical protein
MTFYPMKTTHPNWEARIHPDLLQELISKGVVLTPIEDARQTGKHLLVQTKSKGVYVYVGNKGTGDAKSILENMLTDESVEMPAPVRVAAIELSRTS